MLNSGIRPGEALAVRRQDIDIENETMLIDKNMVKLNGNVFIQNEPKTSAGNRVIKMNKACLEIVK